LDAVGNTTKTLTKGYAIGSTALAAFLLFSAYLDEVKNYGYELVSVDIAKPEVFVGVLLGAMLVFFILRLRYPSGRQRCAICHQGCARTVQGEAGDFTRHG
jgi:Na+/H+-translocating membrane pyrophosphatase